MRFPDDILSNVDAAKFPQSQVDDPDATKDALYKARLRIDQGGGQQGEVFETWLDENFSINVSSSWGDSFSGTFLSESFPPSIVKIAEAMGMPTNFWLANLQSWQATSPIDISLPFKFKAEDDTFKDVVLKARNLAGYVLPREEKGMLIPPGPLVSDQIKTLNNIKNFVNNNIGNLLKSGDNITLEIGEFLIFRPVILKSVNLEFSTQFDINGFPLSINANTELSTYFVGTRKYFKSFFKEIGN